MKLEIREGELKQGYFYDISGDEGEVIATGYYRLEKHANYWGKLALSIYEGESDDIETVSWSSSNPTGERERND